MNISNIRKLLAVFLTLLFIIQPVAVATTPIVVPGLPPVILPDAPYEGAVMHLSFDEGSGNTTNNSVNLSVNNGTLYDGNVSNADGNTLPQWVPGKLGYGLEFDGTDDYVISDISNYNPDLGITVTAWVKTNIDYGDIVTQYTGGAGSNRQWGLQVYSGAFRFLTSVDGTITLATATSPINNNDWFFVAGYFNKNTQKSGLFINGVEIGTPIDQTGIANKGQPIRIGSFVSSTWWNGIIDEPMIFNRALPADEIKLLYQRGADHKLDTNLSLSFPQVTVPKLDLTRDSAVAKAKYTISNTNSSAWVPVPVSAVDISESYAYGIDGKVLTLSDNKYVAASSVNVSIPVRFDATASSELPDELYMDESTKTFEYARSIRVSNPSDLGVMTTLDIPQADLGIASAKIDGSLMSLFDSSLITPISLAAGTAQTYKLSASIPLTKQDVEFRSTFDDFLEIDTYEKATAMAENAAGGKMDTKTRTILLETTTDMSYNNRSVIIPLKVGVKDVIEAKALSGSKELLEVREGASGVELVIPDSAWNSTSVLSIAQAKVIYNKEPAWYESIPGLSALGGFFESLKKLFGGD